MSENDLNDIIPKLPVSSSNLNQEQYFYLKVVLGDKKCTNRYVDKYINYVVLALIATILFIILNIPCIDKILAQIVPDCLSRLIFKAIIFFLIIYLIDRIISNWRAEQAYCE